MADQVKEEGLKPALEYIVALPWTSSLEHAQEVARTALKAHDRRSPPVTEAVNQRMLDALHDAIGAFEATDHHHRTNLDEQSLRTCRRARDAALAALTPVQISTVGFERASQAQDQPTAASPCSDTMQVKP